MKRTGILAGVMAFILFLTGCGSRNFGNASTEKTEDSIKDYVTIGFSQLGAESDWRSANTQSMKDTFTTGKGYMLLLEDGQQKQSNQIMAIRTFIQQEVDYIVLAPVTETGWDTVLQEAKDAGIPVIIVDRQVDVEDESLFTCWIGSDFELEGKKAAEWLNQYITQEGLDPAQVNIVNIQGTIGASAQIGRTKGLQDASSRYGWNLMVEETGDFTQTKGKEVMEALLKEYDDINVVYCENDNEAFGAIEAIEENGRIAGSDIANGEIMVLSFDGVNGQAIRYVLEDKIICIAECNPLHGSRVESVIQMLRQGRQPEKFYYVDEQIYSANKDITSLIIDGEVYPVTILE